jgi:hypothetical protein
MTFIFLCSSTPLVQHKKKQEWNRTTQSADIGADRVEALVMSDGFRR